jgi:RNA polymerase sigma-70 factor, ECF subfamily
MKTELKQISDEELMAAFRRSGDGKVFEELVSRHTGRALSVARAMLSDAAAAEDAVQESFLRLIRARRSYEPGRPFSLWFNTILRNICRDELLRRKPIALASEESYAGTEAVAAVEVGAELREEYQIALSAFGELPVEDREILSLRIQGGWEFSDIAAKYGLSSDAAKKRAYRALERLRRRLSPTAIPKELSEKSEKTRP